jgi:hypothetical protein
MQVVVDGDEWRRSGVVPGYGLQSVIEDTLCPGPKALVELFLEPKALVKRSLCLIEADFEDWLARHSLKAPTAPAEAPRPAKRGRKAKYDWDVIRKKAFELLNEHGDFDSKRRNWRAQADLENKLLEYMAESGDEASYSALRAKDKIPAWLKEWREEQVSKGQ